ncbi:MAG: right-handed parallel beta-helix repeat-containing protein, partial [Deltaproteobacteria bacterium]
QNCIFQNNVWGIVIEEGKTEIHNSLVRTSDKIGIAARKSYLLVKDSVITENGSGGFILEKSEAQIERNNILNNGNWAIKVVSSANGVKAANNWWGVNNPEQTEIIGKMTIEPTLKKPIDFQIAK